MASNLYIISLLCTFIFWLNCILEPFEGYGIKMLHEKDVSWIHCCSEKLSLNLQSMNIEEFTMKISRYELPLYTSALRFTHDEDDAKDLVQDTMVKAMRFHYRFEEDDNIKGWLFVIMRNTFINGYRKNIKKQSMITQASEISPANLLKSSTVNGSESSFALKDIHHALSKLTDTYSVPFIRYVEGYKYEEIAQELNIPLGTVKTRIHQAREILKRQLKMYKTI